MTRIEDNNAGQVQVESLESEVEKLRKHLKGKRNKKIFGCGTCFIILLLLILILGTSGAYVLAKSGLRQIPFFTEKFYQEPSPTYVVRQKELAGAGQDVLETIRKDIVAEALKQQKIENFKVTIRLADDQITAWLQDKVKADQNLSKKINYIQLAVLPDNLELFAKTSIFSNLIVTLNIKPQVKAGKVVLNIVGFKIGALPMPAWLGNLIFAYLTEKSINGILGAASQYGQLDKIDLAQGVISIDILLNNLKGLL